MKKLVTFFAALVCIVMTSAMAWGQITSAQSGNWSSTSTWSGGSVPGASDGVVIADGHTVTIDQDVSVASITVGQGTSGTLTFDGVAARAVTLTGNVTVSTGGTFITQSSGTFTNTMTLGGDLTNNGTFDMSRGGTTLICNVTFNKVATQTVSGSGSTTRFRLITLDKGAVGNKVTASLSVAVAAGAFTFTNGTWEQSAGTLTIGGSQTITATTGAMSFAGSGGLTISAGSITVNGSLSVNTSGTINVGNGNNNITPGTNGSITFTSGTINIGGRLTLSGGSTTINGASIKIDPQGSTSLGATGNVFEVSGTANLTFSSGTLTIVDLINATGAGREIKITSSGTLDFSGGSILLGDGSSSTTGADGFEIENTTSNALNNLTIQTGGIAGRDATIKSNLTVNGTLTMTSGNFTTTSSNLLTLGSAASVSGGSSSSFVSGPMAHTGTGNKTFPIGKGTAYRPVTLGSVAGASPVIQAEVFNAGSGGTAGTGLNLLSSVRYWKIDLNSGTFTSGTVNITYDSDDGVTDPTNLRLAQSATLTGTYDDIGGTGSGTPSGNITSNSISSLSFFTLANATGGSNPLPVQLTSFTATANRLAAELRWTTATEVRNYGFEIERRLVRELLVVSGNRANQLTNSQSPINQSPLTNWSKIAFLPGAGTSNAPHEYSYTDRGLAPARYAYRIKQIDNDGTFEYHHAAEVEIGLAPKAFKLEPNYPNPFNPSTNIEFTLPEDGRAVLKVFDLLGREVAHLFEGEAEAGRIHLLRFDASRLSAGVFYARLEFRDQQLVRKLLLVK